VQAELALQPTHRDAQRIAVAAYFNLLVLDQPLPAPEALWQEACRKLLADSARDARDLRAVAALAAWRAGDRAAAVTEWRELRGTPSAVAARLMIGDLQTPQVDFASWSRPAWDEPLVRLAALRLDLTPPANVHLGDKSRASAVVARLFASPARSQ